MFRIVRNEPFCFSVLIDGARMIIRRYHKWTIYLVYQGGQGDEA